MTGARLFVTVMTVIIRAKEGGICRTIASGIRTAFEKNQNNADVISDYLLKITFNNFEYINYVKSAYGNSYLLGN